MNSTESTSRNEATDDSNVSLPDIASLWDFSDPAKTEAAFREVLPVARSSGDQCYLAELQTQIARTLGLQMKFDDAHAQLDQVESFLNETDGSNETCARAWVRYHLERGRVFNSSSTKDHSNRAEAMAEFVEAYTQGKHAREEGLTIDAAHMVAIVADPDEAIQWNLKALAQAEEATEEYARNWRGSLYNNLGWTYFERDEFAVAMDFFIKALAFREEKGSIENIRIAKWCIARCHRALGDADTALSMQLALKSDYESTGDAEEGYVSEELGELYHAKGDPQAMAFFAEAYSRLALDSWFVKNEAERLERLKSLGNVQ